MIDSKIQPHVRVPRTPEQKRASRVRQAIRREIDEFLDDPTDDDTRQFVRGFLCCAMWAGVISGEQFLLLCDWISLVQDKHAPANETLVIGNETIVNPTDEDFEEAFDPYRRDEAK